MSEVRPLWIHPLSVDPQLHSPTALAASIARTSIVQHQGRAPNKSTAKVFPCAHRNCDVLKCTTERHGGGLTDYLPVHYVQCDRVFKNCANIELT